MYEVVPYPPGKILHNSWYVDLYVVFVYMQYVHMYTIRDMQNNTTESDTNPQTLFDAYHSLDCCNLQGGGYSS